MVTQPKDTGGLGITPLKHANMAMIAKWWWRFRNEKHTLWWNVIWSIHHTSNSWAPILVQLSSSGVWKSIYKIGENFKGLDLDLNCLIVGILGNGNDIRFWLDRWLASVPLMELYPSLFMLEDSKQVLISECFGWHNQRLIWRWRWKRDVLMVLEKEDLEHLITRLINVTPKEDNDKWRWGIMTNQLFIPGT